MLRPGPYEQVIDRRFSEELDRLPENLKATAAIDSAVASLVLSQYVGKVVHRVLNRIQNGKSNLTDQVALGNQLLAITGDATDGGVTDISADERAEQLLVLIGEKGLLLALGKSSKDVIRPETSMAKSSLFTGAIHEPQMYSELKKEIVSADKIDMPVFFIKWSGLRLILSDLIEFVHCGGMFRIITTSCMGTGIKAIEELWKLTNTQIKVTYDTKRMRVHVKACIFHRDTGFTAAYVGPSDMSNEAISCGLEWNVKVTLRDLP